jgi:maltooligosyltrehalose trehalohydrolase
MPMEARTLAALCALLSPFVPLLFMGEEYGETAPFQFFTDHIDEEIAEATREGRRAEFAAFASFSQLEIPDPQDPATFERSKLRRDRDEALSTLYAELLTTRRELPHGDADAIDFDEDARWLRVKRGPFELVCNFGPGPLQLPCQCEQLRVAAGDGVSLRDGKLHLPALSGALVR